MVPQIQEKIRLRHHEFSKSALDQSMKETMIDTKVTYTLKHNDKFYVIEHVPARVCRETGEAYFAPETVEHIHALIKGRKHPDRVIETPVFDYT